MQKQAPNAARIMTMVLFALSCFGLLLFLWLSFGGAAPFKAQGYRVDAAFPEAATLAREADVRVAGVSVGKVRELDRDARAGRTVATIELEREYAPISRDASATLRQKTLLGETYVELRPGNERAGILPEGARLSDRRVPRSTELDDVLEAFDPFTRQAFRTWQQGLSTALAGRGRDLNEALGTLPGFVGGGADLFEVLDGQRDALGALVRNTGVTFEAISRDERQLRALIENVDRTFAAVRRQRQAFADTWRIFPAFLEESRRTFARLDRFSRDTTPLLVDLEPAARDLRPTLRDLGTLGPDLERLFVRLSPVLRSSERSLPETGEVLRDLRPFLRAAGPFLGEVNPILDWVTLHEGALADMFANLGVATAARTASADPRATGHYLRQFGPIGLETVAIHQQRLSSNRGNTYINPQGVLDPEVQRSGIIASFDCRNAGGERAEGTSLGPAGGIPPCREQKPLPSFRGRKQGRFPVIVSDNPSR